MTNAYNDLKVSQISQNQNNENNNGVLKKKQIFEKFFSNYFDFGDSDDVSVAFMRQFPFITNSYLDFVYFTTGKRMDLEEFYNERLLHDIKNFLSVNKSGTATLCSEYIKQLQSMFLLEKIKRWESYLNEKQSKEKHDKNQTWRFTPGFGKFDRKPKTKQDEKMDQKNYEAFTFQRSDEGWAQQQKRMGIDLNYDQQENKNQNIQSNKSQNNKSNNNQNKHPYSFSQANEMFNAYESNKESANQYDEKQGKTQDAFASVNSFSQQKMQPFSYDENNGQDSNEQSPWNPSNKSNGKRFQDFLV